MQISVAELAGFDGSGVKLLGNLAQPFLNSRTVNARSRSQTILVQTVFCDGL